MTSLRRLYSSKGLKIKEAILAHDIIQQRSKIVSVDQQVQCPYIKPRSSSSFIGLIIIKMQYYWWIRDYRKVAMRFIAIISGLLSLLIITIEVLYFFNKFQGTPLHEFLID
jgi:hypothetical protein